MSLRCLNNYFSVSLFVNKTTYYLSIRLWEFSFFFCIQWEGDNCLLALYKRWKHRRFSFSNFLKTRQKQATACKMMPKAFRNVFLLVVGAVFVLGGFEETVTFTVFTKYKYLNLSLNVKKIMMKVMNRKASFLNWLNSSTTTFQVNRKS